MSEQTLEQMMGWDGQENPEIKYMWNVQHHSDDWYKARCGVITASVMKNLLKKKTDKKTGDVTYSVPDTDTAKAYLFELAAQRITGDVGESFQSYAMARGLRDEADAFNAYSSKYEPLQSCGFILNTQHGVALGYSPDGLTALNQDGLMECKSRDPKFQTETLFYDEMPDEYMIQIQTGLIVTNRKWCDFISYCGGMPMYRKRILPDPFIQDEIIKAAQQAEKQIQEIVLKVKSTIQKHDLLPTTKRVEEITA